MREVCFFSMSSYISVTSRSHPKLRRLSEHHHLSSFPSHIDEPRHKRMILRCDWRLKFFKCQECQSARYIKPSMPQEQSMAKSSNRPTRTRLGVFGNIKRWKSPQNSKTESKWHTHQLESDSDFSAWNIDGSAVFELDHCNISAVVQTGSHLAYGDPEDILRATSMIHF